MPRSQLLVIAGFLLALVVGCSSQPAGPTLADQLDAAKELAEFEEEKYQKAVANRDELESLSAQADLNGSKETVEKAQRTLVKLDEKVNEARRRRDEAQEKVHQLAKQIAGD